MTNANESAFPKIRTDENDCLCSIGGLTKREYFAAMAMQGLLAREAIASPKDFSAISVEMANALLAELE